MLEPTRFRLKWKSLSAADPNDTPRKEMKMDMFRVRYNRIKECWEVYIKYSTGDHIDSSWDKQSSAQSRCDCLNRGGA